MECSRLRDYRIFGLGPVLEKFPVSQSPPAQTHYKISPLSSRDPMVYRIPIPYTLSWRPTISSIRVDGTRQQWRLLPPALVRTAETSDRLTLRVERGETLVSIVHGSSSVESTCSGIFGRVRIAIPRKQAVPWLIPPPDTKDKPYICRCGTAFARRDLLTRHERIAHEQNDSTRVSLPRQTDAQVPISIPNYSPQSPFRRPVHASPLLTATNLPWIAEGSGMGTGYRWSQQTQSEAACSRSAPGVLTKEQ